MPAHHRALALCLLGLLLIAACGSAEPMATPVPPTATQTAFLPTEPATPTQTPEPARSPAPATTETPEPTPTIASLGQEQVLANLVAFARLYGYVRYFHPSDEAA
jgi:hypothetical protein